MTDAPEHPDRPADLPDQDLADVLAFAEADVSAQAPIGPADVAGGVLDRFPAVAAFDEAADRAFDRLRGNRVADRSFYAVTELADFGLLWVLLAGVRGLRSDDDAAEFWRLAAVLGVESLFVNGAVKSLFRRERPVVQAERPHRLRVPLTTSFPSGHASTAMVAATLLGEGRRTRPLYFALGVWVASSRIYVRIHHASDVAGGLALGLVLGQVAKRAWPGRKR